MSSPSALAGTAPAHMAHFAVCSRARFGHSSNLAGSRDRLCLWTYRCLDMVEGYGLVKLVELAI